MGTHALKVVELAAALEQAAMNQRWTDTADCILKIQDQLFSCFVNLKDIDPQIGELLVAHAIELTRKMEEWKLTRHKELERLEEESAARGALATEPSLAPLPTKTAEPEREAEEEPKPEQRDPVLNSEGNPV